MPLTELTTWFGVVGKGPEAPLGPETNVQRNETPWLVLGKMLCDPSRGIDGNGPGLCASGI